MRDRDLANRIIESDHEIDEMEVDLEEECLEIMALHQPVASDLRFIVGVFKINQNLERIGDMAANIARSAVDLSAEEPISIPRDYFIMADEVVLMLRKSLDAFVSLNSHEASEVLAQDDHVDLKKHKLHGEFVERLAHEPEKTRALTLLFLVSRHLERIADHATNIAEDVLYMVTGKVSP
jgi:phosphate transport system protein